VFCAEYVCVYAYVLCMCVCVSQPVAFVSFTSKAAALVAKDKTQVASLHLRRIVMEVYPHVCVCVCVCVYVCVYVCVRMCVCM